MNTGLVTDKVYIPAARLNVPSLVVICERDRLAPTHMMKKSGFEDVTTSRTVGKQTQSSSRRGSAGKSLVRSMRHSALLICETGTWRIVEPHFLINCLNAFFNHFYHIMRYCIWGGNIYKMHLQPFDFLEQ